MAKCTYTYLRWSFSYIKIQVKKYRVHITQLYETVNYHKAAPVILQHFALKNARNTKTRQAHNEIGAHMRSLVLFSIMVEICAASEHRQQRCVKYKSVAVI